jgi:outer membrane lipoprotein carrier protein
MKGKANFMKNRGLLLVCVALASAVTLRAGDTAQDVLDRVHSRYEQMNDAEVRFVQKAKFPMAKLEQEISGTLLFKKSNKYRVEFEGQLVVTDGETVWSYSAQNNQVLIDRFKLDERSLSPEKILTAAPEDYAATLVSREKAAHGDVFLLKLVPREPATLLKSMKLWIHEADWLIHKVEMVDQHGKETTYQVNSFKTNIGIPDSRFTYQVPAGIEVVDLRD